MTGNFGGGQAMGSLGGIAGRDHWAGLLVTLRAGKLLASPFSKGSSPIALKPVCGTFSL